MFVYKLDSHFQKIRLKIPAAIVLKIKRMGNILKYPDNVTEKCLQILTEMWKLWHEADKLKKTLIHIFYPRIKVFLNKIYRTDTDHSCPEAKTQFTELFNGTSNRFLVHFGHIFRNCKAWNPGLKEIEDISL